MDYSKRPIAPGTHQLPPLPYLYNALEPVISSSTLQIHHDRHHKSYVDGLNKAETALVQARQQNNFSFIKYWERELAFNGSGHILHCIYWTIMTAKSPGSPGPETTRCINNYFGSYNAFQEQFISAAIKIEGSGWAVLIWQPAWGRLEILTAEKHQDLTQWGGIPILVLDVWEHAYYLDYQNRRNEYVKSWIQLINWYEVENRLRAAQQGQLPLISMSYEMPV
ncbi:MAG: superoxide dismutase [Clostridiales bacterium]|nr:superoxide dismutase [Clostridiales bacterium]MCF8022027.1 superoxide dismutase [Clostridiales bacterium]